MKEKLILILVVVLVFSCKDNSNTEIVRNTSLTEDNSSEIEIQEDKNEFLSEEKPSLDNWKAYYKDLDPNFKVEKFKQTDSYKLDPMEGSVHGVFDKEFDPVYSDFLIYNSTKDKYIDIDSYSWMVEGNEVLFEADQEINVVNIPEKTVTRIGFYGPSYWVEDAYWKNDHTVILLENNFDKIPMISEINLKTNEVSVYSYQNALKNESNYSNQRIQKISNK